MTYSGKAYVFTSEDILQHKWKLLTIYTHLRLICDASLQILYKIQFFFLNIIRAFNNMFYCFEIIS